MPSLHLCSRRCVLQAGINGWLHGVLGESLVTCGRDSTWEPSWSGGWAVGALSAIFLFLYGKHQGSDPWQWSSTQGQHKRLLLGLLVTPPSQRLSPGDRAGDISSPLPLTVPQDADKQQWSAERKSYLPACTHRLWFLLLQHRESGKTSPVLHSDTSTICLHRGYNFWLFHPWRLGV